MVTGLRFFFQRFLPSVLLQHVEDTMVISRLKWTVQTGGRITAASTLISGILSGKRIAYVFFLIPFGCLLISKTPLIFHS